MHCYVKWGVGVECSCFVEHADGYSLSVVNMAAVLVTVLEYGLTAISLL